MSEKKEKLNVGQLAAKKLFLRKDRQKEAASIINKIVEERGDLGSETPDSAGAKESNETGLVPCPFCGSNDVGFPFDDRPNHWVNCNQCSCDGPLVNLNEPGNDNDHEALAKERWNKRVPLTSSRLPAKSTVTVRKQNSETLTPTLSTS